jgi:serine/threonine protein kinase
MHFMLDYVRPHLFVQWQQHDMWALGMAFAELFESKIGHSYLGSPLSSSTPVFNQIFTNAQLYIPRYHHIGTSLPHEHFLQSLLCNDPSKRLNAREALAHSWLNGFSSEVQGSLR